MLVYTRAPLRTSTVAVGQFPTIKELHVSAKSLLAFTTRFAVLRLATAMLQFALCGAACFSTV